jgi:hypothetical protein
MGKLVAMEVHPLTCMASESSTTVPVLASW